ncbi:unnamed protein product [Clavelina lepadiformis]|uniref:Arginase n=1 Tax=Clavelina lepadiformis TaxID=159417 RepID=A0ABP0GMY3_CLALP
MASSTRTLLSKCRTLLRQNVDNVRGSRRNYHEGTGLHRRNFNTHNKTDGGVQIGILGAPIQSGQRNHGVQFGPEAIRKAGLIEHLDHHVGMTIKDFGDVEAGYVQGHADFYLTGKTPLRNPTSTAQANSKVADTVENILKSCDVCLTLGGDHSTAIGTITGHARARENISVLWVDAHPDLNTPVSSPSGNIHGMPLHFLMHDLQNERLSIPEFEWVKPCITSSNLGYIAIRDIDPGEIAIMKRYNIPHCSIREIDRNGIAHCMEKILDMINPSGNRPIHLSFDIDSLDPSIAPATGTRVRGGLTYREGMYICEEVARTGCLSAMDLVEVNPELSNFREAKRTSEVAVEIIKHALGLSDTYKLERHPQQTRLKCELVFSDAQP